MNKLFGLTPLLLATLVSSASAEMVGLDEASLEAVNGQTGIGINIDRLIDIGSITYSDNNGTTGGELQLSNIKIGNPSDINTTAAHSQYLIDVDGIDGLFIDSLFDATRIEVGGVSVGSHIGSRSMGQFAFEFEGTNLLNIADGDPTGFKITSTSSFLNSSFEWSTNGNAFKVEGMTIDNALTDAIFEEKDIGSGVTALVIDIPSYSSDVMISAACLTASGTDCSAANSFGSFSRSMHLSNSYIQMYGGGREDLGLTMNMHFEFDTSVNGTGDGNFTSYTDESTVKFAKQSGVIDITGFTFDIGTAEANIGDHIWTQFDQASGNFKVGDVVIAGSSVGEFEMIFDFANGTHDTVEYVNKTLIAPGVAFAAQNLDSTHIFMTEFYNKVSDTSDGISVYNEWNLNADFIYTDDSYSIQLDNYQTYGSGYVTLDMRSGAANSIDSSNGAETFLAIGIKDYQVNYSFDGFKVGDDSSQLQTGYELLGFSPEASFTMNAGIEIRSGGANGSGATFDGDVLLTNANFGITKNTASGNGIYLDDAIYEFHFRDVTLDVDPAGIQLVLGELWSEFTINDVRFGDKASGSSLGALVINQYQTGSKVTISGGGAGTAECVGGTGTDLATCDGNWIDTGTQGLTIKTQSILQQRNGEKENSVAWVTNRTAGDIATGTSMTIDNIYTSDGYDDGTNTHGIQTTTSIDVAKTRVLKKTTGVDSNGISGNAGDELIISGSGITDYAYVDPATADKTNRPEGLILSNNVLIKELNIESVQMLHPNAAGVPDTMIHGMKLQNLNMTSTLSVTPIR